jgi:hypothetical protein
MPLPCDGKGLWACLGAGLGIALEFWVKLCKVLPALGLLVVAQKTGVASRDDCFFLPPSPVRTERRGEGLGITIRGLGYKN